MSRCHRLYFGLHRLDSGLQSLTTQRRGARSSGRGRRTSHAARRRWAPAGWRSPTGKGSGRSGNVRPLRNRWCGHGWWFLGYGGSDRQRSRLLGRHLFLRLRCGSGLHHRFWCDRARMGLGHRSVIDCWHSDGWADGQRRGGGGSVLIKLSLESVLCLEGLLQFLLGALEFGLRVVERVLGSVKLRFERFELGVGGSQLFLQGTVLLLELVEGSMQVLADAARFGVIMLQLLVILTQLLGSVQRRGQLLLGLLQFFEQRWIAGHIAVCTVIMAVVVAAAGNGSRGLTYRKERGGVSSGDRRNATHRRRGFGGIGRTSGGLGRDGSGCGELRFGLN